MEDYKEIEQFYATQDIPALHKIVVEKKIDIILMDINLGKLSDIDGLALACKLLESAPELRIIILTGYDLPVYQHEAKKSGICGFLNKNIAPEHLVASLCHVYQGGTCFLGDTNEVLVEELTNTEKIILQLLCKGEKRRKIAEELHISERTLSNHLQHIFEKLEVTSSVEAVTTAIQLGYIPPVC